MAGAIGETVKTASNTINSAMSGFSGVVSFAMQIISKYAMWIFGILALLMISKTFKIKV